MGVIACANCRFRVNDQAEHCPECGADPRTGEGAFTDPGEVPGSFAMLRGARVLGGHGLPLSAGAKLDVVFGPETLILRPVSDAELTVPYPEITALEIGGPGARRGSRGHAHRCGSESTHDTDEGRYGDLRPD